MDIYKREIYIDDSLIDREEKQKIKNFKSLNRICIKKCMNFNQKTIIDKEKICFKNCVNKLFNCYLQTSFISKALNKNK